MKQYQELCEKILLEGDKRPDRTGTGTIGIFGAQMRFDLSEGFPLMTTKNMDGKRLDAIIYELLWFLNGDTNLKTLVDNGVNIWVPDGYRWAKERGFEGTLEEYREHIKNSKKPYFGNLGRIYGAQWRSWTIPEGDRDYLQGSIDQIANVIESIKTDPFGRRHIVTAWNPAELDQMALPPCHVLFQFYVSVDGKLSCQLYQRSADMFLGVPFNIASYALLTLMIAQQCDLEPGEFIHTLGDAHIYSNHVEQILTQIRRTPKKLPKMKIAKAKDIFSYTREDFTLIGYEAHGALKGSVSVGD